MASRITDAQRNQYRSLRAQGWSIPRAAKEAGFSFDSAKIMEYGPKKRTARQGISPDASKQRGSMMIPDKVVSTSRWPDPARHAVEDRTGKLFARRYFGFDLSPWQQKMWQALEDGWRDPDRSFLVVNVAPGLGKSSVLVMFAAKLTVVHRDIRGLFISRSSKLAEQNTNRLRRALDRATPFMAADSSLGSDFGRFRPMVSDVWRRNEFIVEQSDGQPIEEKEPTWSSYGFEGEWIGFRLDVLFGDDLDTKRSIRNPDIVQMNRETFDGELEPRLDPPRLIDRFTGERVGGLLCTAQQRLGAFDFSGHVLSKRLVPEDDGSDVDAEEGEQKYRQIIYPAHDEDNCGGQPMHAFNSPPWPVGCLLDPHRLPWRDCRAAMKNEREWKIVFQQQDAIDEEALVQRIWIEGGRGADGRYFLGCLDKDRSVWEIPAGLAGESFGVATIDPSPTRYWGNEAWLWHPASEQRFLLDIERKRMDAPEFLDWSIDLKQFTGVIEDWYHNFKKIGSSLRFVIVEVNAAQRFMLQYDHFHRWMRQRGVQIVAHSTNRNKADEHYGVEMLGPLYRDGKIRLPWRGQHAVVISSKLIGEATHYPNSTTDDLIMSHWFLEYSIARHLFVPTEGQGTQKWRPSWVDRRYPPMAS